MQGQTRYILREIGKGGGEKKGFFVPPPFEFFGPPIFFVAGTLNFFSVNFRNFVAGKWNVVSFESICGHFYQSRNFCSKHFSAKNRVFSPNQPYMMCLMSAHPYTVSKQCLVSKHNVFMKKKYVRTSGTSWWNPTFEQKNRYFEKFSLFYRPQNRIEILNFFRFQKLFLHMCLMCADTSEWDNTSRKWYSTPKWYSEKHLLI